MELVEKSVVMDLHAHPDISPEDPYQIRVMDREGRNFIAYEALAESGLDCVFDNMMADPVSLTQNMVGTEIVPSTTLA